MILHLSLLKDNPDLLDTIRSEMKVSRGLRNSISKINGLSKDKLRAL